MCSNWTLSQLVEEKKLYPNLFVLIGRGKKLYPNLHLPIGDLWSFNYQNNEYVVSPVPDVSVQELDPAVHKCLILGSDGLWNVMTAESAAAIVADLEYHFEYKVIHDPVCIYSTC